MKIFLFVLAILAFLSGFGILSSAKSAIHEIEAFVLYIVSAVFFSGAAIVGAVNRLTEKFEASPPNLLASLGYNLEHD
jgi:cytochrome c oxidase assembly factor CtaG